MSDKLKHIKCKHIQHRHFLITHSKFYNLKFECYKENQKHISEKICDSLIKIDFKHTNQKLLIISSTLRFQFFYVYYSQRNELYLYIVCCEIFQMRMSDDKGQIWLDLDTKLYPCATIICIIMIPMQISTASLTILF